MFFKSFRELFDFRRKLDTTRVNISVETLIKCIKISIFVLSKNPFSSEGCGMNFFHECHLNVECFLRRLKNIGKMGGKSNVFSNVANRCYLTLKGKNENIVDFMIDRFDGTKTFTIVFMMKEVIEFNLP